MHRFTDPDYAALTLQMRRGEAPGEVFDALLARGQVVIHPTDVQRHAALVELGASGEAVIAQTHEQVDALNAAIHDHRQATRLTAATAATAAGGDRFTGVTGVTGGRGRPGDPISDPVGGLVGDVWVSGMGHDHIGVGDRVATRRNDRDLDVANRDTWTVTGINHNTNAIEVTGPRGHRVLPGPYVLVAVQLAYATTVHGVQGDTLPTAHLLVGESTGAAAAYVGMTRGRHQNTAHLVADTLDDARHQWIEVFARDRADLGPRHATRKALHDIDTYGPQPRRSPSSPPGYQPPQPEQSWRKHERNRGHGNRQPGYGPSR